ncbi:MAG: ASKHA domain-containing protein [Promethearchaeota archaeon]
MEVTFEPDRRRIQIQKNFTVLDVASQVGIQLRSECGGQGTCGKCRVHIEPQTGLNPLTSAERIQLTSDQQKAGFRLACQARINGETDLIITIPTATHVSRRQLQITGTLRPIHFSPALHALLLRVSSVNPNESKPDTERVLASLAKNPQYKGITRWEYPLPVITKTPQAVRKANGEVTLIIRNQFQLLDIQAGDARESIYGCALDIGTSKIAGSLYSLTSAKLISSGGIENPQLRFGEDIMTRLSYAAVGLETRKELQSAVIEGVNTLLGKLVSSDAFADQIFEVIVVGNTVMTSLFLGLDTTHLGYGPFVPPFRGPLEVSASQLGLNLPPQCVVYILPNIAGYVGADAVADILATGIHEQEEPCLLIDIGTNSEVILGNQDHLVATSCAAGPAFEGAGIKHGMKAVSGAIERVSFNTISKQFNLTTINNIEPRGICGSGVVDTIAQLAQAKLLSSKGRFTKAASPLITKEENIRFITLTKGVTKKGLPSITLSEQDISQLLLAKAAIKSGYTLLLKQQKLDAEDLGHVYVAGAFGTYLNPESAQRIGLIPPLPLKNISLIGNAALVGAQQALLSTSQRQEAQILAKFVEFLDLARHPEFSKTYAASLFI